MRDGRKVATRSVVHLARPAIRSLEAYSSARSLAPGDEGSSDEAADTAELTYLDANEAATENAAVMHDAERGASLVRYPDPQPADLVARVAELYGVGQENVVLGRGADEAIDLCLRVFCRPGLDRILVTPPTYGMYAVSAAIQGAAVQAVPLLPPMKGMSEAEGLPEAEGQPEATATGPVPGSVPDGGWALDVASLVSVCEAAEGRIKLVFLCSPGNPTGGTIPADVLLDVCAELDGRAVVVVDEAYVEFAEVESLAPWVAQTPNLVVLRTLSKAWGLAGARFGMAFAHADVVALLQKVRAPYPLATPVIEVVRQALRDDGLARMRANVAATRARRNALAQVLARAEAVREVFPSEANFLLMRVDDAGRVLTTLKDAGIVVRDRSAVEGLEGCLRISVGSVDELMRVAEALGVAAPELEALARTESPVPAESTDKDDAVNAALESVS